MRPTPAAASLPRVVVLQSFGTPVASTNPYIVMLRDALAATPGVRVRTFGWRTALLGRYDVFHAHWPEALIESRRPATDAARRLLYLMLLLRLRLTRRPIVRTVHNLRPPEGLTRTERLLLRLTERWTTRRIALNDDTGVVTVIPHGHYREWFERYRKLDRVPGRFTFVGRIRRYKRTPQLVAAFMQTDDPELSLHVVGKPSSAQLRRELTDAAATDPRVTLLLDFVDDDRLVAEVTAAELVVLPYAEMHNSGAVLAALSLDRPVLVPDNEVNRRLGDEVGAGWVHRYDGPLTAAALDHALLAAQDREPGARPDLSGREWTEAGPAHRAAYRDALATVRPRRSAAPRSTR